MEAPLPPSVLRHGNEWDWAAGGVATARRSPPRRESLCESPYQ
jgi:hypothetical protein